MTVGYHPAVKREVSEILRRYDRVNPKLGDAFWEELMRIIEAARQKPEHYHRSVGELRRANLTRFPYHFLFRPVAGGIRITAVRHHRRDPAYGIARR